MNKDNLQFELGKVVDSVMQQYSEARSISAEIIRVFHNKGKLLWCGNGGSSAECQHMSAEYMVRFKKNRIPLPSIALTSDMALITAHSNDYDYNSVFSRQIEALGTSSDILIAISTSGNSQNILNALKSARDKGMKTVLLSKHSTSVNSELVDFKILINSEETARIQEGHTMINHIICELVEASF
jgi:D-sedoheptulose 7-phosphate isomerase